MRIKNLSLFIIIIVSFIGVMAIFSTAYADMIVPTDITVYFQKNDQPYNQPINFTISCYGYRMTGSISEKKILEPGTYKPYLLYSHSYECPNYGCVIRKDWGVKYGRIDYCNFEGTDSENNNFIIEKYSDKPFDLNNCTGNFLALNKCDTIIDISDSNVSSMSIMYNVKYNYNLQFLVALIFTLIIEILILLIFIKKIYKYYDIKNWKIIVCGGLASMVTMFLLWYATFPFKYSIYVYEGIIIFIEALIYKSIFRIKFKIALIISLVANLLSYFLGIIGIAPSFKQGSEVTISILGFSLIVIVVVRIVFYVFRNKKSD